MALFKLNNKHNGGQNMQYTDDTDVIKALTATLYVQLCRLSGLTV